MLRETSVTSAGERCGAWYLPGEGDAFAGQHGRPCVVMAHGFGGTRDTGLLAFAEGFAEAGLAVLLFDYRGFADSTGQPRQDVAYRRQRADYHAAIAAARRLPGVDPRRIVLWGTSYSGGHVLPVGTRDGAVAAAIAMTPATDGAAALALIARRDGLAPLLRLTGHGLRDLGRAVRRREPHRIPIAAEPGELGVLTAPGALAGYTEIAGPTWRNEVCARACLEVGLNRPTIYARRVGFPLLVQVGEQDRTAPPAAARRAAEKAGAELRSYPVDHFDVYTGEGQQRMLADQLAFLQDRLGARPREEVTTAPAG